MTPRLRLLELFAPCTAVGLVATVAAPWVELQGTFQSWRIVEWHTFWRGSTAFQLENLVSGNYDLPIEFATTGMQSLLEIVNAVGSILAIWHAVALLALLVVGARIRLGSGVPRTRVWLELASVLLFNVLVLYGLAILLAMPSSLSLKVAFRTPGELYTDALIWSNLVILPLAPIASILAVVGQLVAVARARLFRTRT